MTDKRVLKTQASVKEALLTLLQSRHLAQISVSEIATTANISRSTFYSNYQNIHEVFDDLVRDFMKDARALKLQLRCKGCRAGDEDGKTPFCMALREPGPYKNMTREPEFLPALLRIAKEDPLRLDALAPYIGLGLPNEVAEGLFLFQMAGCYTAALDITDNRCWAETQTAIDTFVAGGLSAVRRA